MSALSQTGWTREAYLTFEQESETRHEFVNGQVIAMAGASRAHDLIVITLLAKLYALLLQNGCESHSGDIRVRLSFDDYAYPDISIVCDEPQFEDTHPETLLNPTLLIEVLSPSTEKYDRGSKGIRYRSLPSLKEYLLISQDKFHIEHYRRQANGEWGVRDIFGLDASITFFSIEATLQLKEVYEQVSLDETIK